MSPDLVLVEPTPDPRSLGRNDVIVRKGQFTLVNSKLTPQQSLIEDLLAIRDVLDAAEIEYLLVRDDDDHPILAVDRKRRSQLERALAAAFATEPFYSKAGDAPALFVADGRLSRSGKSRVVRLFRPRIEPVGRLRYGASNGVRLEFWDFGVETIVAPSENALMRTSLPRSEAIDATVSLYGREWRTLDGMFATHATDITFDIDMVFSWVDGTAIEFQRARALRMQAYVVGEGDDSEARYRQIDELKYALRSVYMFAPWVRRIFIVTDSPRPVWLDDHPSVTIVRSEEFFQDVSVLPTHSSHAVESQLHHIPGLSEHFLYSNDDMFFGRPVTPDMFFSPGGITKFIEATTRIGLGENNPARSGFENAARVNRRLLQERFGRVTTRHLEHAATPLRKSVLDEMEREFAEDFRRTAASPFRSSTDISVTNSFYHYYALMTGRAVVQTEARVLYIETTLKVALKEMDSLLKQRSYDFFCLNDGSAPEISVEKRTTAVVSFLDRYFGISAPWETTPALEWEESSEAPAEPVG
ncbi:stealth conserved region 3 domain-containing protein [Glaciihabitans sp. dw_435]|uniref:stealth conserved region 3 domain-containing protein n=1 Tax=Glaciihabitans sp. dw_435 TaxID=2720081 RepID=UPI0027DD34A2|nr:stealth conserved region 3 domain-containing protein [Glaciihabitans sp. dw_435]